MNKSIIIFLLVVGFSSCVKRYELATLDNFQVTTNKRTYAVGDSIIFNFSGNPDNIVFWSGDVGHNYDYRNRTEMEGNTVTLNFTSYAEYGVFEPNTMRLMVSTDFSGIYDSAHVANATWEDITSRATLSSGTDQTPSGNVDLTDYAATDKPLVIAFRHITTMLTAASKETLWIIRSFDINSTGTDGTATSLASISTAGWTSWDFAGPLSIWTLSSSQIHTNRVANELEDDWAVTKQFNPNAVSPDQGVAVKNISQSAIPYFTTYATPGTYNVVFEAINANIKRQDTARRKVTITITP